MKRAILVTTGTVAGLVGVLGYQPPEVTAVSIPGATELPTSTATETTTPSTTPSATSTSPSTPATTSSPAPTASSTPSASSTPTATPTKTSSAKSGTYTGDTAQTRWGPVQVQIVVSGGKITAVNGLQYPSGDRRSMMISSYSIPELQRQTLAAQSANIDGVSGASYTTMGWTYSLKSALTKAGL